MKGPRKKDLPPVAPPPREASPLAGKTVFLTEFGPMTSQEYGRNLEVLRERQWEEAERARKAAYSIGADPAGPVEARPVPRTQGRVEAPDFVEREDAGRARREGEEARRLAAEKEAAEKAAAEKAAAEKEAAERRMREETARELAAARKAEEERALNERKREMLAEQAAQEEEIKRQEIARANAEEEQRRTAEQARLAEAERKLKEARLAAQQRAEAQAEAMAAEPSGDAEESGRNGSRLGRLNNSIFKIVKERIGDGLSRNGGSAAALSGESGEYTSESVASLSAGDRLVLVRERTPFYLWGPMQGLAPDEILSLGERVTLVSHGKIWSEVRLASGKQGLIANDFMEPAPAAEITITKSGSGGAGEDQGPYGFEYTPLPEDLEPPELPDASQDVIMKTSLLPEIGFD